MRLNHQHLLVLLACGATLAAAQDAAPAVAGSRPESAPATRAESRAVAAVLKDTRNSMGKWIETQQIFSKERRDWQQGRDILLGRIELVKQEVTTLEQKIKEAEAGVTESDKKKQALVVENDALKAISADLVTAVTGLEVEVKKLYKRMPEPIQTRLHPLHHRIPEDPANTRVSIAERYQNVVGILNEVNKANNEITVSYEVHTLADGKPSEVKAIYVGLAQAYYVSAKGEGGIGRPTEDGWKWEPSKSVGRDVLVALEILQNKHSPAFVPLPVKIQ